MTLLNVPIAATPVSPAEDARVPASRQQYRVHELGTVWRTQISWYVRYASL
jgi:hypothetical protein